MTKDELTKVYSYCLALIDFIEGNSSKEMFLEGLGKELGLGNWSNVLIEEAIGLRDSLMRRCSLNDETKD